jgi:hypothetical protein
VVNICTRQHNSLHFINLNMILTINKFSSLLNINWVVFLLEAHCVLCKVLNETLWAYSGTVRPCRTRQFPTGRSGAIRIECTVCMVNYIHGSLVEIQTPTYWNPIGRSMTAPPPLLSSSSILPSSSHWLFVPARKTSFKKMLLSHFYFLLRMSELAQLCVSWVASVRA